MSRIKIDEVNGERPHQTENVWMLKIGDIIGDRECPLMRRWVIQSPWLSIRLHHFYRSDNDRMLHDHPWWFITIPLSKHGYLNETYCKKCQGTGWPSGLKCNNCEGRGRVYKRVPAFRITYRPPGHTHAVKLDKGPCWTFIITGRKKHDWGFWDKIRGKFYESREFHGKFGHPACED